MVRGGGALFRDPPAQPWYGWDREWRAEVEREIADWPQFDISAHLATEWLAYWMTLDIPGRKTPCEAVAVFEPPSSRPTYGLAAMDSPTVYGDLIGRMPGLLPDAGSSVRKPVVPDHRNRDASMCLWYVRDQSNRRWTHEKGIVALAHVIARQIFSEDMVRRGHAWPLDEAPHGLPESRRRRGVA